MLALPDPVRHQLELARERREPHAFWQYPAGVVLLLSGSLAMGITLSLVNMAVYRTADPGLLQRGWQGLVVGLFVQAVVGSVLFVALVRALAKRPAYELGWVGAGREFGAGVALGGLLISVSVGIIAALGGYRVEGFQVRPGLLVGLAVGVGAGFLEECVFRGVFVRLLDKHIGAIGAVIVSSVIFGAVHLTNAHAGVFGAVAIILEAGPLLAACYLLTRRLWLAIGVHAAWNFFQGGFYGSDVSGSGLVSGGLLKSSMDGPQWLTGGAMGLEGSYVTLTVGFVAGVLLLVAVHRRGHLCPPVRNAPVVDMQPPEPVAPQARTPDRIAEPGVSDRPGAL